MTGRDLEIDVPGEPGDYSYLFFQALCLKAGNTNARVAFVLLVDKDLQGGHGLHRRRIINGTGMKTA